MGGTRGSPSLTTTIATFRSARTEQNSPLAATLRETLAATAALASPTLVLAESMRQGLVSPLQQAAPLDAVYQWCLQLPLIPTAVGAIQGLFAAGSAVVESAAQ